MYKALVADNRPVLVGELTCIIKEALDDVNIDFVDFSEVDDLLINSNYEMLIWCQPVREPVPVAEMYNIARRTKSLIILILSEDVEDLPIKEMYHAGIRSVLGRSTERDEIRNAIKQVHNGQYLYKL